MLNGRRGTYHKGMRSEEQLVTPVIGVHMSPMVVVKDRRESKRFYMTTQHEFCFLAVL